MSPVLAGLRTPLKNTFALYANGRRKDLSNLNESSKTDAEDPYQKYKVEPSPSKSDNFSDRMIVKTGEVSAGTVQPVDGYNVPKGDSGNPENPKFNKIIRTIVGKSSTNSDSKIIEVDTVLGLPGMTHFVISSDIDGIVAPSPVNVMGAAISFCFLTLVLIGPLISLFLLFFCLCIILPPFHDLSLRSRQHSKHPSSKPRL